MQNQNQGIIYTHRTRDGRKARIVSTVNNKRYPVIVAVVDPSDNQEYCEALTQELKAHPALELDSDLFEHNPWQDVRVDTPILVKLKQEHGWDRRYFAKYENGKVYTWIDGRTSWTAYGKMLPWDIAELPETEE